MTRYMKTFPSDRVSFDQYKMHTKPMLELLVACNGALPFAVVEKVGMTKDADEFWTEERENHLTFVKTMCVGSLVEVGELQFSHKSFSDWLLVDCLLSVLAGLLHGWLRGAG